MNDLSLNEQIKIVEIDDFGPLYEKGVRENDIIIEIIVLNNKRYKRYYQSLQSSW